MSKQTNISTIPAPIVAINPENNTMKSTDLHRVVFHNTGKFASLSSFHKKVTQVLVNHNDSIMESSTRDARGYVECYNLNEIQCNMVMASIDLNHLEVIATYFVAGKTRVDQPKTSLKDKILLASYERENELRLAYLERKYAMKDDLLDRQELEEIKIIEARRDKILIEENLTAHADMKASKVVLPTEPITNLLRGIGSKIRPSNANFALFKLGYLELNKNRGGKYVVSDNGKKYGRNLRQGTTYAPRWFVSTFDKLIVEIESSL